MQESNCVVGMALGALAKKECRYCPDDSISWYMYRKAKSLQRPISSHNDYRGITCINPNVVKKMVSIYERMEHKALLRRITHGETQNENKTNIKAAYR